MTDLPCDQDIDPANPALLATSGVWTVSGRVQDALPLSAGHPRRMRPEFMGAVWKVDVGGDEWELVELRVSGPLLRTDGTASDVPHTLRVTTTLGRHLAPEYMRAWLRQAELTLPKIKE